MIEKFPSDAADYSFTISILPAGSIQDFQLFPKKDDFWL
jgi:hypothetical protein